MSCKIHHNTVFKYICLSFLPEGISNDYVKSLPSSMLLPEQMGWTFHRVCMKEASTWMLPLEMDKCCRKEHIQLSLLCTATEICKWQHWSYEQSAMYLHLYEPRLIWQNLHIRCPTWRDLPHLCELGIDTRSALACDPAAGFVMHDCIDSTWKGWWVVSWSLKVYYHWCRRRLQFIDEHLGIHKQVIM